MSPSSGLSNGRRRLRPPPAISRLDAHVGYWLRCVANDFSHALNRALGDKGVPLIEWLALRELYDGDLQPTVLAEKLGLTRGATSKLARRLESTLLITQELSAGGKRARMLSLTEYGRYMVQFLAEILDETDEEFFGHLHPDTRALIIANMREIVRRCGLRAAPAD